MNNICLVEVRDVYGRELIYPRNENALHLASLAGKKTLDRENLRLIEALGYKIEYIARDLKTA